ncbi:ParB/RepB/Spo0J family partition protein [Persicobacter diffluens]|uniref:ParB-like N-terminal domain-containing protein n=1 Tax=Persicobacter diffluens TaxID=981 RepID=A0AAN5APS5_9BACT|nr:hypothetical protein PEDI_51680 [Persicobacter diffluens]
MARTRTARTTKATTLAEKAKAQQTITVKDLTILEELESLLPFQLSEETEELKDSIKKEGVRDPFVLWERDGKKILVDGHHRRKSMIELGLEDTAIPFTYREFSDLEEVIFWMRKNQLARRNLSKDQVSYLRGMLYNEEKGSIAGLKKVDGQNVRSENVAQKIAAESGVNEKTVRRDGKFAEHIQALAEIDPGIKEDILSKNSKIRKSDVEKLATSVKELPKEEAKEVLAKARAGNKTKKPAKKAEVATDPTKKIKKDLSTIFRNLISRVETLDESEEDLKTSFEETQQRLWENLVALKAAKKS